MTDREVNIPLLRKAVEWVEEQEKLPEIDRDWDQMDWVARPYARAGRLMNETTQLGDWDEYVAVKKQVAAHCGTTYCVAGYIGQLLNPAYAENIIVDDVHVAQFAMDQLGLNTTQKDRLFHGMNTAADVRRVAEWIAGQPL